MLMNGWNLHNQQQEPSNAPLYSLVLIDKTTISILFLRLWLSCFTIKFPLGKQSTTWFTSFQVPPSQPPPRRKKVNFWIYYPLLRIFHPHSSIESILIRGNPKETEEIWWHLTYVNSSPKSDRMKRVNLTRNGFMGASKDIKVPSKWGTGDRHFFIRRCFLFPFEWRLDHVEIKVPE